MTFETLTRSEINRRTALVGLSAGGAAMVLGLPAAKADTPSRGGHVRYGVRGGSTSDTLDPATFTHTFVRTLGYGLFNTLVEVDANNQIRPELLESWEASDGAKTWILKLRKGITFHNGKSFNADDVLANIAHHSSESSKSGVKSLLAGIQAMTKVDANTVRINLDAGNADFPVIFADYRMMILPAKDGGLDTSGVGTGGYTLKEFERGVRAGLTRNRNYWRSDRAFFESAEILSMSDPTARQNALITGAVDIIDQIDLKTVDLMKRRSNIEIMNTSGGLHYTYAMDMTLAPFDNLDVRLALKFGVDRQALLQKVLRGYGSIGNDHPISPSMRYYAADIPQTPYDIDRAKFHLKKAGMEKLEIELHVTDGLYPGAVDGVTVYKESLAPTGINLTVAREPTDGYFSSVWLKKPFVAGYWAARPTADVMFSTAYGSTARYNETRWKNDKFDAMLVAARVELDEAKRSAIYRDMQIMLHDQGAAVIPLFADSVFGASTKIGHPEKMSGAWELDGGRSIERWWRKA